MNNTPPEVLEKLNEQFESQWLAQPSYRDSDKEVARRWFIQSRQTAVKVIDVEYNGLTYDLCHAMFRYDPESGKLFSKLDTAEMWRGQEVGILRIKKGHYSWLVHHFLKRQYQVNRIIWFMQTGELPEAIDNINGDSTDNRWVNMRAVTKAVNTRNAKLNINNKTGVHGVYMRDGKYRAMCKQDGKQKGLGTFLTIFDAVAARISWQNKNGFHENHGRRGCGKNWREIDRSPLIN